MDIKPIQKYEGLYRISRDGEVFSQKKKLKPWITDSGYLRIYLYKNNILDKENKKLVRHLYATTFTLWILRLKKTSSGKKIKNELK